VLPGVGVSGLLAGIFEAAEMPIAHYAFLRDQGDDYTAIPVFPDRMFLRRNVFVRPDSGIASLADLVGRRVAVPMYWMTSSFWHRRDLRLLGGLGPEEVSWVTTAPERDPRMSLPAGVKVDLVRGPHLGLERLLDGSADCLMTEAQPVVPEGAPVVSLHADPDALDRELITGDGVHPLLHVIVFRRDVADRHPDLVARVCAAFDVAKQCAYDLLQNERMTSLPFMRAHLDETEAVFGADPFPYGTAGRNGTELAMFLAEAHGQGLTRRRLEVDELFHEVGRVYPWSARMTRGADLGAMESLKGVPSSRVETRHA
jgi:4,5-dihydroxyphthalate decarboxylase